MTSRDPPSTAGYPRDSLASCLPSVCLPHSGIVLERLNLSSKFYHQLTAPRFSELIAVTTFGQGRFQRGR